MGHRDTRHKNFMYTGSEIVSREIDPVLFIHLLTADNILALSCSKEHRMSHAVNNYLVISVLSASHPSRTDSGPPVTPFPIVTGGGA